MQVIGVCGRKRHGKDTVGGFLHLDAGYTPIAFADPIKRIAMDLYGFSYEQVYGDLKEEPDPRWDGLTPRHAMQQIGTEVARAIHPDTWVRYCLRVMQAAKTDPTILLHSLEHRGFVRPDPSWCNLDRWVVVDVRFPNEAVALRSIGGSIIKVVRPELEGKQGDTHASETEIDKIKPDVLLFNDGTLEELAAKVRRQAYIRDWGDWKD